MSGKRRTFTAAFKAKVALEAIKGQRTVSEIAQQYQVHPNQVSTWKRQAIEHLSATFEDGRRRREAADEEALRDQLYQQIGKLKVELDWVKKERASPVEEKRRWIQDDHPSISISRQCDLIGLSRSSYYFEPAGEPAENLTLMRLIDEEYTRHPFYGSPKMTAWLRRQGHLVNPVVPGLTQKPHFMRYLAGTSD